LRHPAVLYAAAVGRPDAYAGEIPVAYIKPTDGASVSESELLDFAKQQITERAAVPAEILIVDDFPLTDVRKPAKDQLRYDAARRTFERVIRELLPPDGDVSIQVGPDSEAGTLATIVLRTSPAARPQLEAAVAARLSAFSMATHIIWSDAS